MPLFTIVENDYFITTDVKILKYNIVEISDIDVKTEKREIDIHNIIQLIYSALNRQFCYCDIVELPNMIMKVNNRLVAT